MRKNLIPLLAIALVIAGLCTVIFYGLIADRVGPTPTAAQAAPTPLVVAAKTLERGKLLEAADLKISEGICPSASAKACFPLTTALLGRTTVETVVEGQPFTEDLISKRTAGSGPSSIIPVGMRAVTLHAADSSGVVKMIRHGDRVDLQVIGANDPQSQRLSVQRIWENVEVLDSYGPDPGSSHAGRPVLTVLLPPVDAERLSLADTTSRIRVVLRNRQEKQTAAATAPAAVTAAAATASAPMPSTPASATAPTAGPSFLVRLVSVNPEQLSALGAAAGPLQPQVNTLPRQQVEEALTRLEQDKTAHVLGSRALPAGANIALGADGQRLAALVPGQAGVRLKLDRVAGDRWRLEPEAQAGRPGSAAARRAQTEAALERGQAWLVSGLLEHKEGRPVLAGEGSASEPRLLLVVTPEAR